uniref:THO complex subunit 2 n=1 Tax=Angiostrongylus cantonensis TaxID=6313 RepID=A0A158P8F9_ANGCA
MQLVYADMSEANGNDIQIVLLDLCRKVISLDLAPEEAFSNYKQAKYNLLREESEGYSKLITELMDGGGGLPPKTMMTRVLCLIGQFNLDPNRVTDIVLECFECCASQKTFYISLLKEIKANKDYLCTLLGFNPIIEMWSSLGQVAMYKCFLKAAGKETPFSLYIVTSSLIQEDMIDLMKITGFMVPKAEGIKETHRARAAKAGERARKAETILASNIPLDASRNANVDAMDNGQSIVGVSLAAVAAIQEADDAKLAAELNEQTVLSTNQKLGLVCALIEDGAWPLAKTLIDRLPEYYAVQASTRVSNAISDLIGRTIENFYIKKCSNKLEDLNVDVKVETRPAIIDCVSSWDDLASLTSMLWYVGPRLAYRPLIMTKLVRLITMFYREQPKAADGTPMDSPSTLPVLCSHSDLRTSKLRSKTLGVVNNIERTSSFTNDDGHSRRGYSTRIVVIGLQYWSFGRSMDLVTDVSVYMAIPLIWTVSFTNPSKVYRKGFRTFWKFGNTMRHPEVNIMRGKVLGRTKYVLKRLSKETVRVMGRQLGKLCHIHPVTVFDYLLSQVQSFDNLIQPVVESLRFLTNLEFDLSSPEKQQLKASDGKLSPWMQALATLVGAVYKKYNVELAGMLNYVINQLKNEKSFDLLVLREVIQNMACIEGVAGATSDQLEALGGGELLRQEAGSYTNARNKRASARLRDAVMTGDIAIGLCILIAQQRECVVYRESSRLPLKLVGEMVDQCRDTLLQLGTFLWANVRQDDYAMRIPPAHTLILDYHLRIDAAIAFSLAMHFLVITQFVFFKSAFDDIVAKLMKQLEPCIPKHVCRDIPVRLLVVFWILSSYDIEVPTMAYERAIENIRRQMKEVADSPVTSKSKRAKEEERLRSLENKLKEEEKRQAEHIYSAKLIIILHQQRITLFQSLVFIDKLFIDVLPLICALTENEANSIGTFLQILLSHAQRWHSDSSIFEKECEGFPGLVSKTRQDKTTESVNYESFRRLCFKWQMRLHTAFNSVLSVVNNEYVSVRNCLVVMTKLAPCFPLLKDLVDSVEKLVEKVRDNEKGKRDELSLKAASYLVRLKMRNVPVYEGLQFHRPIVKQAAKLDATVDRKRISNVVPTVDTRKKVKLEKPKTVERKEPERKELPKVEKREKKEELTQQKEAKKDTTEREEGEVPPSPPHKKMARSQLDDKAANGLVKERKDVVVTKDVKEEKKDHRDSKEKREDDKKVKDKRDSTPSRKEDGVKESDTFRKKERGLDDEEVGPAVSIALILNYYQEDTVQLPPSMREERVDDRKREQTHKRSARDDETNGHSKIARKDREQIESRLSRIVSHERRGVSPTKEKDRRDEKKDRRKESKPIRK